MPEVRLDGPYQRIGTPAHTGPYSRLRGNHVQWLGPARQAWEMIVMGNVGVRAAAARLGMSPTTAWRRAWWYEDWIAQPQYYGLEHGPAPHQRGTRAVPNGRPLCLPRDAEHVLRDLRGAGYSLADIIGSRRAVPKCIRDLAAAELAKLADIAERFRQLDAGRRRKLGEWQPALYRDLMHLTRPAPDPEAP